MSIRRRCMLEAHIKYVFTVIPFRSCWMLSIASPISPLPPRKAACSLQSSTKLCAAFRAASEIVGGIVRGVSKWNRTCIVASTRRICPRDFDSIPMQDVTSWIRTLGIFFGIQLIFLQQYFLIPVFEQWATWYQRRLDLYAVGYCSLATSSLIFNTWTVSSGRRTASPLSHTFWCVRVSVSAQWH